MARSLHSASMARSLHLRFSLCTTSDSHPGPGRSRTAASCQPQAWRPSAIPLQHRRPYRVFPEVEDGRGAFDLVCACAVLFGVLQAWKCFADSWSSLVFLAWRELVLVGFLEAVFWRVCERVSQRLCQPYWFGSSLDSKKCWPTFHMAEPYGACAWSFGLRRIPNGSQWTDWTSWGHWFYAWSWGEWSYDSSCGWEMSLCSLGTTVSLLEMTSLGHSQQRQWGCQQLCLQEQIHMELGSLEELLVEREDQCMGLVQWDHHLVCRNNLNSSNKYHCSNNKFLSSFLNNFLRRHRCLWNKSCSSRPSC